MPERNDHELLAEFARSESENAFASLVQRHVNLVYSAALRSTNNPSHAEEITQAREKLVVERVKLQRWLSEPTHVKQRIIG